MNDQAMRLRVLRVLEAIDFEQREHWARRIVCSSIGATALALGLNGCLPPGPLPSREPAPIAQPDLGGCPNCEYAAPIPIDHPTVPKYAADIYVPRPAYAMAVPAPTPSVSKYGVPLPQSRPAIENEPVARYAIMTPRE